MKLYKRKGVYYADLRHLGAGRVSLHTDNKQEAKRRAQDVERRAWDGDGVRARLCESARHDRTPRAGSAPR